MADNDGVTITGWIALASVAGLVAFLLFAAFRWHSDEAGVSCVIVAIFGGLLVWNLNGNAALGPQCSAQHGRVVHIEEYRGGYYACMRHGKVIGRF